MAHFEVRCLSEQNLEITVFTEGHLLFQQNAILAPGTYPFDCKTESAPTGKYFILVTGNGIHIEQEFTLSN